jgi:outer membrane protein assembly factor BamB
VVDRAESGNGSTGDEVRLRQGALAVLLLGGLAAAPEAGASETSAVASRMNAAHSGTLDAASPAPPLRLRWTRELDSPDTLYPELSYPLVVDGRVFIVAARTLHALSAETGATLWSVPLGRPATLAYDSGRLIVGGGAWVRAYDAATGQLQWTRELETDECAPVAADGVVYTKSAWIAYALRVSDGTTLWSRDVRRRAICEPTVGPGLVYYGGETTIALRRSDGTVAWTYEERGSNVPLAHHGGRLWHAETHYSPALGATTGSLAGGT